MISAMMHPDPSRRPSARELLESPHLPSRLEDDQMKDAMRALSQPHSPFFHRMMDELFADSRVHIPSSFAGTEPRRRSALRASLGVGDEAPPPFAAGAGGNAALYSRLLHQVPSTFPFPPLYRPLPSLLLTLAALYSRLLHQAPEVMVSLARCQDQIGAVLRRHASVPLFLPPLWLKQVIKC